MFFGPRSVRTIHTYGQPGNGITNSKPGRFGFRSAPTYTKRLASSEKQTSNDEPRTGCAQRCMLYFLLLENIQLCRAWLAVQYLCLSGGDRRSLYTT